MSCEGFLEAYRRVGWEFVENEWLSPVWLIAKRSHILHLSNSFFTKKLIRKLYGLDSIVLYPPVLIKPYMKIDLKRKRKHSVLISKPEVLSGITMLPQILRNMPKSLSFLIIGMADSTGLSIIQALKKEGFNMKYLGYVSVKEKVKLMQTCSHYLHLGLNEPFGMTVVEAMAAGCIPIAPESGGIPEYLPKCLLYSSPNEASEKILSKTGIDNLELKLELRRIATSFSEKIFRVKFLRYFERLVSSLKKGD
ncbi:glycosyltransferase [Candidatus Bathyarchaeota archaeon]|nr:glycosyltransferase [Candidatus Bathyarchaeota archaeon]